MTKALEIRWDTGEKMCGRCRAFKPFALFYKWAKNKRDGHSSQCKACLDERRKVNKAANMERERASRRESAKRHPETKARYRALPERKAYMQQYSKQYYEKNKDRLKPIRAAWHEDHKAERNAATLAKYYDDQETWRARNKAWAQANPERMREFSAVSDAKRRAATAKSKDNWTADDVREIFTSQRGKCAVCRERLTKSFHRDHIVPLARGGSNDRLNLQLLCKSCNCRKSAKDPIKFMQENGYLL
jgi:5-methylcytosine-specific restriction endonuclease McrA